MEEPCNSEELLKWARENHGITSLREANTTATASTAATATDVDNEYNALLHELKSTKKSESFSTSLCNLSLNKYGDFTKSINKLCIESAEKGNVHLVLTKKELDQINFPIDEYNLKLLRVFLQEENLVVSIDPKEPKIEIFWMDLVISKKTGGKTKFGPDVSEKFPSISDSEVKKLLVNDNEGQASAVLYPSPSIRPSESMWTSKKPSDIPVVSLASWPPDDDIFSSPPKPARKKKFNGGCPPPPARETYIAHGNVQSTPRLFDDIADGSLPTTFEIETASCDSRVSDEPSGSDDNVFDIQVTLDDIREIDNMTDFVKSMIDKANKADKHREKERIIYTMFLTILKVENEMPSKNKHLFKSKGFMDNLVNKLNEMLIEGDISWPAEMLVEFEEIKRNRFPDAKDMHSLFGSETDRVVDLR